MKVDLTVATDLPRIPVINNKQRVIGLAAQSRMVEFLSVNVRNFKDLAHKRISTVLHMWVVSLIQVN